AVAAGVPQEAGVVGVVDAVAGIRVDCFQVGLLRGLKVLPGQPQEARVPTQCLRVRRLQPRCLLEVVLRPVTHTRRSPLSGFDAFRQIAWRWWGKEAGTN
ncbi:hypothetical protein BHE74_00048790, partial [Ensete ventricosum]